MNEIDPIKLERISRAMLAATKDGKEKGDASDVAHAQMALAINLASLTLAFTCRAGGVAGHQYDHTQQLAQAIMDFAKQAAIAIVQTEIAKQQ